MKSAHKLGLRKLPTGFQIEYHRSRECFWSTATVEKRVELAGGPGLRRVLFSASIVQPWVPHVS
jgi:hypothetical protein